MSALAEIGDYLEAGGVAVQNVDLFLGTSPEAPDTCLTIYQYSGNAPEYVQDVPGPDVESPQIQVRARSRDHEAAFALAYGAWLLLSAVRNQVLGSTYYRSIMPNGSPGLIGRDAENRLLISFNATVAKEVPVGASS